MEEGLKPDIPRHCMTRVVGFLDDLRWDDLRQTRGSGVSYVNMYASAAFLKVFVIYSSSLFQSGWIVVQLRFSQHAKCTCTKTFVPVARDGCVT